MKKNILVLLLFMLIQLCFYFASIYFFYRRPLIVVEWFIPFFFLFWRFRLGFLISAAAIGILDVILGLTQIYLLIKPMQWLYMAKYIQFVNIELLILVICGIAVFCVWMVGVIKTVKNRHNLIGIAVLLLVASVANTVPALNGFAAEDYKLYQQRGLRLLGSGVLMLDRFNFEMDLGLSQGPVGGNDTAPWPHTTASDLLKKIGYGDKVLFIVLESFGQSHNPEMTNSILSPLINSPNIKVKYQGNVKFSGGTVEGELRELCHFRGKLVEMDYIQSQSKNCLPQYFKDVGYKTSAFHAASGVMYDRELWYPMLNFDEVTFFKSKNWPIGRCYSFAGWCDSQFIDYVWASLDGSDKQFSYWLTLNSHFPYSVKDVNQTNLEHECAQFNLGSMENSAVCRHYVLEKQLIHDLSEKLQSRPVKDLTIVLVGDHTPIFVLDKERKLYAEKTVPVIVLSSS